MPSAPDPYWLWQHACSLKRMAEAAKPASFATCPIVIDNSLLDFKLTSIWMIAT
jgi:hypothetical protein